MWRLVMIDIDTHSRVRNEAAFWFARMRRPDNEQFREAFEQWLHAHANREAYNRIAARFSDAKILRKSDNLTWHRVPKRTARSIAAICIMTICVLVAVIFVRYYLAANSPISVASATMGYSNERNDPMSISLTDGSMVVLDTNAAIEARFTATQRLITLSQGRARFTVAHGSRPFQVIAANTKVIAHGTIFDVVIMSASQTRVALYSGSVAVSSASSSNHAANGLALTMKPGDVIEYNRNRSSITALPPTAAQEGWPVGILDYEAVTLAELIMQANRYSGDKIELDDASTGKLKLSGRFRIRDSQRLADQSARIFGLSVDRTQPGKLILKSR
jgi:transmembrane sensor